MRKILQFSMATLVITALVGCGTDKNVDKVEDTTTGKGTEEIIENETTDESVPKEDVNHNNENKLELADDVAAKIVELAEVESANVIVTNNNAYVGVMLKEGVSETQELETKIAEQARATNGKFDNVYVSTNPDFAKQFNDYGEKIRANEPIEGFFTEFSDTVKRVFPDAH
ncbi:MAG: YhcN/YlaJ family sporulation lipoprotein [Lysinibacillus sp.]